MARPTNDPRSQLLSQIRVTKGERLVFELKAAITSRGDMSKLIRDAVAAYRAPLPPLPTPCPDCGIPMGVGLADREYERVRFTGVPVYSCPNCGRTGLDARIAVALEDLAEQVSDSGLTISVDDLMGPGGPKVMAGLVKELATL